MTLCQYIGNPVDTLSGARILQTWAKQPEEFCRDNRRSSPAAARGSAARWAARSPPPGRAWCWSPATRGPLAAAVAEIRAAGGEAHAVVADVADKDAAAAIAGQAAALVGPIDLLINNASTLGPVPLRLLLDTDCEDLERALAVNLVGAVPADQGARRPDGPARRRHDRQRDLRRGDRGLRALGRLRRVEGGAGAARARLGGGARRHGRAPLHRRPRRDGHAHARRRDPRRQPRRALRPGARRRADRRARRGQPTPPAARASRSASGPRRRAPPAATR